MFIIYLEYFKEFGKVPNLQNKSILHAIAKYKSQTNAIEEEILTSVIDKITLWNEKVLNKNQLYDGDVVQKDTNNFIKQQEYRKLGETIITKTKNGEIKSSKFIHEIDDRISKIIAVGQDEDDGMDVTDGVENALRKEFRQTIATGVLAIDEVTGGGLGKGEIGIVLAPSGVGKTTLLTRIANTAHQEGKKVAQIVFEDTVEQIQRKHYAIWSKIRLSQLDDNNDLAVKKVNTWIDDYNTKGIGGKLIIKRFSQDGTTLPDIKNWLERHEKKYGYKFDIVVLDYLDKLEAHRRASDRNEAELQIVKAFEAMAGDLNIPCWSAIQGNRSSLGAEFVDAQQTGGNIKRMQIAHFFMSIAKTDEQKESHQANIKILKARFAQDGQTWKDCIFNNDTMEIRITDSIYNKRRVQQTPSEQVDLNKIENKVTNLNQGKIHDAVSSEFMGETIGDIEANKDFETKKPQEKIRPEEIPEDFSNKKVEEMSENQKNDLTNLLAQMREEQGNILKE